MPVVCIARGSEFPGHACGEGLCIIYYKVKIQKFYYPSTVLRPYCKVDRVAPVVHAAEEFFLLSQFHCHRCIVKLS